MSRSLGCALPPDLFGRLSARDLDAVSSKVIQLFTVDARGWAHPALLSYFEVIAVDPSRLRIATYGDSATTANIRRTGKATLVIIDERLAVYVKTAVVELAPALRSAAWNAAFECRVDDVLVDEVDESREPGAYVSSGVTYYSPQRVAQLEQARRILAELAALP